MSRLSSAYRLLFSYVQGPSLCNLHQHRYCRVLQGSKLGTYPQVLLQSSLAANLVSEIFAWIRHSLLHSSVAVIGDVGFR